MVRLACHHEGMNIHGASLQFGISRVTVSKMLKFSDTRIVKMQIRQAART